LERGFTRNVRKFRFTSGKIGRVREAVIKSVLREENRILTYQEGAEEAYHTRQRLKNC